MKREYNKREKISITKYDPKYRNNLGHYIRNEWTSIYDIGKTYDGVVIDMEEYCRIENLYVNAVFLSLEFFNSRKAKILHLYAPLKKKFLKKTEPELYHTYLNAKTGDIVEDFKTIEALVRLSLRESIAELELQIDSKSRTEILFGYDYYMYIKTNKDISQLSREIEKTGLFVY